MKYSKEFLQDAGLLLHSLCIPLDHDPDRGLFLGVYSKASFPSVEEFVMFTTNISSITQDWYSTSDLDGAYEYYYPPDHESPSDGSEWLASAQKASGNFLDWLDQHEIPVDSTGLPEDLDGELYWAGDGSEFGLIGDSPSCSFEAFIAERLV